MNQNTQHNTMTFDEALKDSSLAHLHKAILFVKDKSGKELFPKKYESGVIDAALETVVELFEKDPNMLLKSVVTTVFEGIPGDLSAALILKITNKVIQKWENLTAKSLRINDVVVTH